MFAIEENTVKDVCIFIVKFYIKTRFTYSLPIIAQNLYLKFIKALISYKIVGNQSQTMK